jgi:phospholipase/lecithinase/hemolysin
MRQLRPAVFAVLALGMLAPVTSWAGFTQIVAFGDSRIDTGNVFGATGNHPAPYSEGRYWNGSIWVEYLADKPEHLAYFGQSESFGLHPWNELH